MGEVASPGMIIQTPHSRSQLPLLVLSFFPVHHISFANSPSIFSMALPHSSSLGPIPLPRTQALSSPGGQYISQKHSRNSAFPVEKPLWEWPFTSVTTLSATLPVVSSWGLNLGPSFELLWRSDLSKSCTQHGQRLMWGLICGQVLNKCGEQDKL